jgi:hypothetical protein
VIAPRSAACIPPRSVDTQCRFYGYSRQLGL